MSRNASIPVLFTALLFAALLVGCGSVGGAVDSNSDGDQVRDRALAVFIGPTITDRVEGDKGDNTDWKYIDVVEKGRLTVEVRLDNPEKLKGAEVAFFDEFGSRLDRFLISGNQPNYIFAHEVEKIPNKFFVKVFAKDGRSAYSVGAKLAFAPSPAPPAPVEPPPPPEPVAEAPPPPPKPTPRKRRKRRVRKPAPKPEPAPAPVAKTVKGQVVRVLPSDDGKSVTLTVMVPAGSSISKSTQATALKSGAPIGPAKVLKVSGSRVTVRVAASPTKFTGSISVKFNVQ